MDQANIGRLFQYVVLLANQKLSMCTPQILFYIFDSAAAPRLIQTYPGPMRELLLFLQKTLVPEYKQYFSSKQVFNEIYNQDGVLAKIPKNEDQRKIFTGVDSTIKFP